MQSIANPSSGSHATSPFVAIEHRGDVLTIRPAGPRLGEREAGIIAAEIEVAIDRIKGRLRAIVLDLSDVHVMSSFGLGLCIGLRNSAKQAKASAVLVGLSGDLAELFKLMKVDRLYKIAGSRDELTRALAA